MPALLIATVRIDNPEIYQKYVALTPDIVKRHGGRFVVRGGSVTTLEGEAFSERLVVIEFPDMAALEAMYGSPEYREAMKYRQASSEARFIAVETIPEGAAPPA